MTDKDLGTAAGDIFAKAFTLGYEPAAEETKALPTEVGNRIRASVTRWSSVAKRCNIAEATLARVREGAQMLVESFQRVERDGNRLYDSATHRCADNLALLLAEAQGPEHLRAALEGEQQ
ncbi:hypothetical protein R3Q06_23110 [Rhodococcus erythropolis]|uniref:hypothetical protein n=1 Tax=Rhodococcus erythropolis TaxID=1833 RepID=UPI00294928F6|nr:hypothetical protein [Rhodococcus erythropolis]MDV6276392.1 hypothetical protein [Rhodococcus erythropolis]